VITPFAAILQRAVQATPNAIGGAFADADGEMVDSFSTIDPHEWAVITAHYGVVLAQLSAAFGTWHFGGPEYFLALHKQLDIIVHCVEGGYYALIAARTPANLGMALETMRTAAIALRKEMQ
jgi:predicted regulator of Ras-like GTPase activity (Roadblock/LC7/MglB family)